MTQKSFISLTGFFLLVMILVYPSLSMAQQAQMGQRQPDSRMEAIESRRVAHITSELALTRQQAREFWPVYNEYLQKVEELGENLRQKRLELPPVASLSAEQAATYVEDELRRFEMSAQLRREYSEKLLQIISIKQLAMLYEAERSFNRMLFREAQRRTRSDGRGGLD